MIYYDHAASQVIPALASSWLAGSGSEVCLDLMAVAAAGFPLHQVAALGRVGDDAVGAAFGDAQAGREVAQPHARVVGDAQQDPGVVGQEISARHR